MNVMNPVSPTTLKQSVANPPKKVSFELLLDETTKTKARIPMRVVINPHDTTDSIIATVKNWYGIYEGHGVSFEDMHGNTLIARYENVVHEMVIYVRIITAQLYPSSAPSHTSQYTSALPEPQRRSSLGEPFYSLPPHPPLEFGQGSRRPTSFQGRKRSASPPEGNRGRSISQQKSGSRSELRSRNPSSHDSHHEDATHSYSDSDGGYSSVTGSRKTRSEHFVRSDISLENVLQDGRRNRPKFDSSELPLFVPPQVPVAMSQSSMSPQRQSAGRPAPAPFALPAQKLFHPTFQPPFSPHVVVGESQSLRPRGLETSVMPCGPRHGHRLRDRHGTRATSRPGAGYTAQAILPTPDSTIASCISDEDVARQLIALGDASNFSLGRTSASTLDDGFSGVADVASSTGATSDTEEHSDHGRQLPTARRFRVGPRDAAADGKYQHNQDIKGEESDSGDDQPKFKKFKANAFESSSTGSRPKATTAKVESASKNRPITVPKASKPLENGGSMQAPIGPAGSPVAKSTASTLNFQHQLGADEEDLSTKPRCQRCRKSKKGCDRQRPCQRCKDAGIGIEGCLSEDEGNGRKGRYGRHMGVAVKKSTDDGMDEIIAAYQPASSGLEANVDKGKKRKRS